MFRTGMLGYKPHSGVMGVRVNGPPMANSPPLPGPTPPAVSSPSPSAVDAGSAGQAKAYLVGGGIGSLAAAAFLIRDAGFSGKTPAVTPSDKSIWVQFEFFIKSFK